jgi:hypothetical protein
MTTTSIGSFVAKFSMPQAIAGTHTIIVVGQTSLKSARASVRVKPSVFLRSSSGIQGSQNLLTGYGFGASETIRGTWNLPKGKVLGTGKTNGLGTFTGASAITFVVPVSPKGTYRVYATGATSRARAYSTFELLPSLHERSDSVLAPRQLIGLKRHHSLPRQPLP